MLIKVKAHPDSRQEKIVQKSSDAFEVWVKAKALQGEANEAVARALAVYLNLPSGKIRLIKGGRRRGKIFEILK